MSVILISQRKKAMNKRDKKIIRKVGCNYDGGMTLGEETASWKLQIDGRDMRISFSRDTMNVIIDDENVEVAAYLHDDDYDVDLIFELDGHKGHIYSDVEGPDMTNYLFVDDKLVGKKSITNCVSKHRPGKKSSDR
ncbi:uncharacterized protein LOC143288892 [Babylonia areolata]|uniref:uncharacterized protein LOC143288892 n=1 Tax=Babylonia areolata TaxID=304850 RepID=UPI003FCFA696